MAADGSRAAEGSGSRKGMSKGGIDDNPQKGGNTVGHRTAGGSLRGKIP